MNSKRHIAASSQATVRAFTLIELLVVVTIITLLAGLSFPAVMSALEKSRQMKCLSNLRQIGTASLLYSNENNGEIMPAFVKTPATTTHWNASLLEFYNEESNDVYKREDFSCTNWKQAGGEGYTNWNWGYGYNETPLYEGPGSNSFQKKTTRITIDSNGSASSEPVRLVNVTHSSKRLQVCCAQQWSLNYNNVGDTAAFTRHNNNRCNALFFDGHAEPLTSGRVIQAITNPNDI